jgi:uncharacterized protein (DUF433 family)
MEADMDDTGIDWTACPDVERVPGRVSGRWVVKDSRIIADSVIGNFEAGLSAEEIADDVFEGLGRERARRIIEYARKHVRHPVPHV